MSQIVALVAALVAIAVFLYGVISYLHASHGREARRVRSRLDTLTTKALAQSEASLIKDDSLAHTPWAERLLASTPRAARLKTLIAQAGLAWTAEMFFAATAVAFLVGFLVTILLAPWPLALLMGAASSFVPLGYLCRQRSRRMQLFETQFPESLDLISRALRAGHAFGSGLKVAAEEGPEPLASEFRLATEEINLGLSATQALLNLGERVPFADMRFFVTAVLIQRETGGNLTEILDNISKLIRERMRLFATVRVLSAEGRLSAYILVGLPIFTAAAISVLNPGYLNVLFTDETGNRVLMGVIITMLLGIAWIRRIIRIEV
jgi:tight adherence protein B